MNNCGCGKTQVECAGGCIQDRLPIDEFSKRGGLLPCPFCGQIIEWNTDLCGFIHDQESFCVIAGILVERKDIPIWNRRMVF